MEAFVFLCEILFFLLPNNKLCMRRVQQDERTDIPNASERRDREPLAAVDDPSCDVYQQNRVTWHTARDRQRGSRGWQLQGRRVVHFGGRVNQEQEHNENDEFGTTRRTNQAYVRRLNRVLYNTNNGCLKAARQILMGRHTNKSV